MILPYFPESPFDIRLSFSGIIEHFEKVASDPLNPDAVKAQSVLNKVSLHPELKDGSIDFDQLNGNEDLIGQLLEAMFPPALTLNEIKAATIPFTKVLLNPTERFKNLLRAADLDFEINIRDYTEHQFYVSSCCLILNEFYGTQLDFSKPLFYDIPTANGVLKHYRILYNADFLDIIPTEKSISLTAEDINQLLDNYDNLELWKEKFPKGSWRLSGFAIMTLYDATVENAVSILKEKLLISNTGKFKGSMESIFRSIYKIPDIQIGASIFSREHQTFDIIDFGEPLQSFVLKEGSQHNSENTFCSKSHFCIIEKQDFFAVSDVAALLAAEPENLLARHMAEQGINSFILAPITKNGVLMGVLEIVSMRSKELNSVNAHKLEIVMPFLVDTIDRLITEFRNEVQAVIQKNYTSIHSSVYWKFSSEAQNLIRANRRGEDYVLKEIILDDVYPLYGQTDIKGSSDTRNQCIRQDLTSQLKHLLILLPKIKSYLTDFDYDTRTKQIEDNFESIKHLFYANTEQYVNDFLENKIHPYLQKIAGKEVMPLVDAYFIENDKKFGTFYANRRKYETSVSMINNKLATYFDNSEASAQTIYPHYYERFKTDGVEHNLYIGPSISPKHHFDIRLLQDLRLWQLRILCKMELAHHQLKKELPYPLDVTSLILAYHSSISLRFRMDEKRFDVDGTYNARYEVVKKRIDKAFIKDTTERITQTGKITIVYSGRSEEKEYRQYIEILQNEKILADVVENFQVEDLQGVVGLHALRAQIIH
ncbi:GAF domain-containing protein [Pedobacter sp. HMF7647]|uniref:GAF domain-containing protein n=1 Tax=Hufsiella arboris TaxID=2695275 RepID=A0A7K1YCF0_9SPHI|nr:GAF domain-containing protein [Hufsiella arboris]MXV52257.1 GAF domain-containing protein [Hufsiella arboris]